MHMRMLREWGGGMKSQCTLVCVHMCAITYKMTTSVFAHPGLQLVCKTLVGFLSHCTVDSKITCCSCCRDCWWWCCCCCTASWWWWWSSSEGSCSCVTCGVTTGADAGRHCDCLWVKKVGSDVNCFLQRPHWNTSSSSTDHTKISLQLF